MKLTSLVALIFTLSITTAAATFNVNITNDTQDAAPGNGVCADSAGRCSLRAAITETNALGGPGHDIYLPSGTYTQTILANNENNNAGGDWDINSNVNIYGAGPTNTFLRANMPLTGTVERVVDIFGAGNAVALWNLTIERGRVQSQPGGGIRNLASLSLSGVTVTNNQSNGGGGIYTEGSLSMTSTSVNGNRCVASSAACFGGGIYARIGAGETFTLIGSGALGNESNSAGTQPGNGGGIAIEASGGSKTSFSDSLIGSNLSGGSGSRGAGLLYMSISGSSTLSMSTNTRVNTNRFHANASSDLRGVGIALETSSSGQITGQMDGVHLSRNPVNFDPSNSVTAGGNMSVYNNGGQIQLTMKNSSVTYGKARNGGGIALINLNSGINFSAVNTTFGFNNTSHPSITPMTGNGGGLYLLGVTPSPATANFDFCTFSRNGSASGHAIYQTLSGTVNLKNSVVAGNHALMDQITGNVSSQNYNHFEYVNTSAIAIQPQDIVGTNPLPSTLTNDQYFLPSPGLLVNMIPNGTNGCGSTVTSDQRGIARPQNGNCDKGSIELQ